MENTVFELLRDNGRCCRAIGIRSGRSSRRSSTREIASGQPARVGAETRGQTPLARRIIVIAAECDCGGRSAARC